jgi:hypothetical protein
MRGLTIKENPGNGYTVIFCHHTADPFKQAEWKVEEEKNYPNPNDWKRLYDMDAAGKEGTPVYPIFSRDRHVARLSYNPSEVIYRSYDFGVVISVCKYYQVDQWQRVLLLAEYVKAKPNSFRDFVVEALDFQKNHFLPAENNRGDIIPIEYRDFGDYAGTYQSDGKGQVYSEVLEDFKISVETSPFSRTTKIRAIELLNRMLQEEVVVGKHEDGTEIKTPKFLVDESCEKSIEAYGGAYVYDKKGEKPLDPNHPYEDVCDTDHYFLANKFMLMKVHEDENPEENLDDIDPITGYIKG